MRLVDKIGDKLPEQWKRRPEILQGGPIPLPMHGLAPRVVMGKTWWERTRKAAYLSTFYHCVVCGVHKTKAKGAVKHLEGHEVYEIDWLMGEMEYVETVPLCNYCHSYIHEGRLNWLLSTRKISQQKYAAIIRHGDSILCAAGLERRPTDRKGPQADWGDWRLIVGKKSFKSLYANFNEWKASHG